jgi:hypothetical protein
MSNKKWYKFLLIVGTILILATPIWWFFAPPYFGPMLCNPEDYSPSSGNYAYFACTDVYLKIGLFGTLGQLTAAGLLIYFASRTQRKIKSK